MEMGLILCATDGSQIARKALALAADLARAKGAKLLVVHVQPSHGSARIPPELRELERIEHVQVTEADILQAAAEHIVAQGADFAKLQGAPDVETLVAEGDPAGAIVETARSWNADAIVIGSRGLGDLQGLLLGSVSHKVAHLAPCTCIIVR